MLAMVFMISTPSAIAYASTDTAPITIYNYGDGTIDYFLSLSEGNLPGQLERLRIELERRFSTEIVEEIVTYAGQKTTYDDYLADKFVYDSASDRYINIHGDNDQIAVFCCDAKFTTMYNKKVDKNKAIKIAGYYVPNKTDLKVTAKKNNGKTVACFRINVDLKSYDNDQQLKDLASILLQKHSMEAVHNVIVDFGGKHASTDALVSHMICDSKTGKLLWIKESKVDSKYVEVYVCSDQWTKELTEYIKEEYYEIISGFVVPLHTDLGVIPEDYGGWSDIWIALNVLKADYSGQVSDMKDILLQKCDKSTVNKVAEHVMKKKDESTHLAFKSFYDKKSKRTIWVDESRANDVNIYFGSETYSKLCLLSN